MTLAIHVLAALLTADIGGAFDNTASAQVCWIFFADKAAAAGRPADAHASLAATYNPRAVRRRALRRTAPGLFDERDLPICEDYLVAVADCGVRFRVASRWVNAVSVEATGTQRETIAGLPFVRKIERVRRWPRHSSSLSPAADVETEPGPTKPPRPRGSFYGLAEPQLSQINLIALHNQGFTGTDVVIGILDTGFRRTHLAFNEPGHPLTVVAEYDFVAGDGNTGPQAGDPATQHEHGTFILGTLGAYRPTELVGAAYNASYVLAKVEDVVSEYALEEDWFVAGLEYIESHGGDVATSSLVARLYGYEDMDGITSVMAQGLNTAAENGLHCCQGAGNEGHDSNPATNHLLTPADAFKVIACGAVDSGDNIASFSSDGPTTDGRIKPEVLARGVSTRTVSPANDTGYSSPSGTSLSTPLVAGVVACLVQNHPDWTVDQMRVYLSATALGFVASGTFDPLYIRGFGIVNATAANLHDCNGNDVDDAIDIGAGAAADCNANGIPDSCDVTLGVSADADGNGVPDECPRCPGDLDGDDDVDLSDLAALLAHFGAESGASLSDGDLDGDQDVDLADLAGMLARFGAAC